MSLDIKDSSAYIDVEEITYMASYILRNFDETLWRQVKSKAALEGVTVKALIERLLKEWLAS